MVLAERSLGHTHRHHEQRHLSSSLEAIASFTRCLERTDERRAETERVAWSARFSRRAASFELHEVSPNLSYRPPWIWSKRAVGDEEDGTSGVHPGLVLQLRDLRDCGAEKLWRTSIFPFVVTRFVVDLPCWGGH